MAATLPLLATRALPACLRVRHGVWLRVGSDEANASWVSAIRILTRHALGGRHSNLPVRRQTSLHSTCTDVD